jgi:hypothetical protein
MTPMPICNPASIGLHLRELVKSSVLCKDSAAYADCSLHASIYLQTETYELKHQLADRNAPVESVGYAAEGRLSSASAKPTTRG